MFKKVTIFAPNQEKYVFEVNKNCGTKAKPEIVDAIEMVSELPMKVSIITSEGSPKYVFVGMPLILEAKDDVAETTAPAAKE